MPTPSSPGRVADRRRRVGRWVAVGVAALTALTATARPASAQDEEEEGGPTPSVVDAPVTAAGPAPVTTAPPATTLPAGCVAPEPPDAVFTAELLTVGKPDLSPDVPVLARFRVGEISKGSLDAYAGVVPGSSGSLLVDVDFGRDVRHLRVGERYLVAAQIDSYTGALVSKARVRPSLFGENQVVGIDDDPNCPTFVDPIITVLADGSPVETGLLSPLLSDRRSVLGAFGRPALVIAAALIALVLVKRAVLGIARLIGKEISLSRAKHRRTLAELDRSPAAGEGPPTPRPTREPAAR